MFLNIPGPEMGSGMHQDHEIPCKTYRFLTFDLESGSGMCQKAQKPL